LLRLRLKTPGEGVFIEKHGGTGPPVERCVIKMAVKIQRPKGTADVVPSEIYKWHYVEKILRETANLFGYEEIRFPVFEHTELFIRGVGDTTDVVQKEMYTFEDKGGRSISLRPEGTASTVRAYLENSLYALGAPFKAYYLVPNFRYEKPQSGRLREHHQFGVECFGAQEPCTDAEVISLVDTFLKKLSVADVTLKINSIGCPNCRPLYQAALREYFEKRRDELCDTCKDRLSKNPMRILDCKSPVCSEIASGAPKTIDFLCEECGAHFDAVKGYLSDIGIPFEVDPGIVRGLDYYTRTVFEFVSNAIGAKGTICGGGRYDGLIETLGGPKTPGMGFGCGIERLLMVMDASNAPFPERDVPDLFLCSIGDKGDRAAQKLCYELRVCGVKAERDLCGRSVKAQMKNADKLGARFVIVLGDDEIDGRRCVLRDMKTKEETEIPLSSESIKNAIGERMPKL